MSIEKNVKSQEISKKKIKNLMETTNYSEKFEKKTNMNLASLTEKFGEEVAIIKRKEFDISKAKITTEFLSAKGLSLLEIKLLKSNNTIEAFIKRYG